MRHPFALVLGTLGTYTLSACSDTLDPPPGPIAGAAPASPEVASLRTTPGTVAGMLGELTFRSRATRAHTSTFALADGRSAVLPNAYAEVMGEANNVFPFAVPDMRYQQIFLGSELGALRSVSGLCLRGDEIFGWGPASTMQVTVKLGPTRRGVAEIGAVFDDNYSAPPTTVFSGTAAFPASETAGTPDAFNLCIDFTTRYVHPAGSNFIVEIVNANTSGGRTPDACDIMESCTTRRVYAFSATATSGTLEPFRNFGLIMKFVSKDPASKADCRNGVWEGFGFRNQGECVRFIQAGKDGR